MAFANEQSYEEMIRALQDFVAKAQEQCNVMQCAGQDCVDNTDEDPVAVSNNEKLNACVGRISATFEEIMNIADALQNELEEIRNAAAKGMAD